MKTGLVSVFLGKRICTEVVELPSASENMGLAVLETRAVWVPVAITKVGPAIELACAARWHGNLVAVDDVRFSLGSCPLINTPNRIRRDGGPQSGCPEPRVG